MPVQIEVGQVVEHAAVQVGDLLQDLFAGAESADDGERLFHAEVIAHDVAVHADLDLLAGDGLDLSSEIPRHAVCGEVGEVGVQDAVQGVMGQEPEHIGQFALRAAREDVAGGHAEELDGVRGGESSLVFGGEEIGAQTTEQVGVGV